jgi:very-short-patch-repair endonuclease
LRTSFTIETIKKSACGKLNPHLDEPMKKKSKVIKARNDCPEVQYIHWQLKYWCIEQGYTLEKEYRFAKPRKFRFDFCLPEFKIAVEYDGLNSEKSGHTTLKGFTSDTEKINIAISLGWKVLRFTVLNYQTVLHEIEKNIISSSPNCH